MRGKPNVPCAPSRDLTEPEMDVPRNREPIIAQKPVRESPALTNRAKIRVIVFQLQAGRPGLNSILSVLPNNHRPPFISDSDRQFRYVPEKFVSGAFARPIGFRVIIIMDH